MVSVTSKRASPLLSDVAITGVGEASGRAPEVLLTEGGGVVEVGAAATTELPLPGVKLTVFPVTGRPSPSRSSTETVASVLPSAGTDETLETTVESAFTGTTGGGVPKVTDANWSSGRLSVESTAA